MRHTFYLIGCEACGHFEPPPKPTATTVIAPPAEPMRCTDCGDLLLLIECWIADEAVMWQERPGAMWHHVPFADRLPTTDGRRLFV